MKITTRFHGLGFAAFAVLLFAGGASAQVAAIQGDAKAADGSAIKGALIQIERTDGIAGSYRVKTDNKGHFGHYGMPLGQYKISLIVNGETVDSVDNARTRLGQPFIVNFDLGKAATNGQTVKKAAMPPGGPPLPSAYVSAQTPADQLQLNADNSFSLQEAGQPYSGTFAINGSTLEIKIKDGPTTTMTLEGSNLKDSSQQTWVRQDQPAKPAPSASILKNQDIINLAKAGIDDAIIIAKIGISKCQFDTSPDALIQLKTGGVSGAVLSAMLGAAK